MYAGHDFTPADPEESRVYTFDFVKDLMVGETITNSAWTCEVAEDSVGTDDTPTARLVLFSDVDGTFSKQRVAFLLADVKYVLQAVVNTSEGNTISLWSHVLCVEPS